MSEWIQHPSMLVSFAPELVLTIGILGGLVRSAFKGPETRRKGDFYPYLVWGLALCVPLISVMGGYDFSFSHEGNLVVKDKLSFFASFLILLTSGIAFERQTSFCKGESNLLVMLSLVGLLVMVSAHHLITLYVGIELSALPLYAWIAIRREQAPALEAAIKYFILGAVASGLLLLGFGLIYAETHALSYAEIAAVFSRGGGEMSPLFSCGILLVFMGFLFKLGAAPFHFWMPDAYEAGTVRQVSFMAMATKSAAVIAALRFLFATTQGQFDYHYLVIFSLLIGALSGLKQTHLQRLLAYSGVMHMGYLLMGFKGPSVGGTAMILNYLLAYVGTLSLVFLTLLSLRTKEGGEPLQNMASLKGLGRAHPYYAGLLALGFVSLMGIPPLPIFWGKMGLLLWMLETQSLSLALLAVISSVIAAFYYLKLIKYMYFDDGDDFRVQPGGERYVVPFLAVGLLAFSCFQSTWIDYFIKTLAPLFALTGGASGAL